MRTIYLMPLLLVLAGCAATATRQDATHERIRAELDQAAAARPRPAAPAAVSSALLPPLQVDMPKTAEKPLEQRFDLVVNNAPANQVFMGIVSGTRYSMLVHPDVTGGISVNLKDVTVFEALDSIRELYGYDYKVEGTRIFIQSLGLQTRIFHVNYLSGKRSGTSDMRVISGSVSDGSGSSAAAAATTTGASTSRAQESSKITTSVSTDFWSELKASLEAILGGKEGRSVVVSPQSGVIVMRAMPDELRNVEAYLKASQLSVDRQVILEAKILDVVLNDSYQAGVNWSGILNEGKSSLAAGGSSGGFTANSGSGTGVTVTTAKSILDVVNVNPLLSSTGGLFGIAFANRNFAALIELLQTQGSVNVLSSPRIATLNNQKAVLKVGTDEFFVTNVSTTTTSGGTSTTTTPTVTLQPFFSGIALDVTPQIDENGNIILHIHPSVSQVTTVEKTLNLGSGSGTLNLPLASSNVSETDSVVRAQDGQIVAIGGLMRQSTSDDRSQLPGAGDVPGLGALFRRTGQVSQKRELVILLKPTVVQGSGAWTQDILDTRSRMQSLEPRSGKSEPAGNGNR